MHKPHQVSGASIAAGEAALALCCYMGDDFIMKATWRADLACCCTGLGTSLSDVPTAFLPAAGTSAMLALPNQAIG